MLFLTLNSGVSIRYISQILIKWLLKYFICTMWNYCIVFNCFNCNTFTNFIFPNIILRPHGLKRLGLKLTAVRIMGTDFHVHNSEPRLSISTKRHFCPFSLIFVSTYLMDISYSSWFRRLRIVIGINFWYVSELLFTFKGLVHRRKWRSNNRGFWFSGNAWYA